MIYETLNNSQRGNALSTSERSPALFPEQLSLRTTNGACQTPGNWL
jgi:hypothetical protein